MNRDLLHQRIDSFAALQENWDSYHAAKIAPDAIQRAHEFLDLIPHYVPNENIWIAPDVNGGVCFEITVEIR